MVGQRRAWGWAVVAATAFGVLEGVLATVLRAQARLVLAPGPASLDEVAGVLAAALAMAVGAWLAVGSTAAVLAHTQGRLGTVADRLAAAWAPLLTRRVAAALVGATIAGTLAPAAAQAHSAAPFPGFSVSASATPGPEGATQTSLPAASSAAPPSSASPSSASPSGAPPSSASPSGAPPSAASSNRAVPPAGWTPSRPRQQAVAAPGLVTSGAGRAVGTEVVVHRGDTLWDLVAAHLGPDATEAEVAEAWPHWYAANTSVIGDDPDRLLPGQVLRVPSAAVTP
ncbi:hypothetical protein ABEG17_02875 [Pedococcus sp. KACC 23699]|uniref:LysM domain-containing protein n=1 Tax=Pedococcus sp. KACC 23699 TaxID=3149228 RepID=A0AAU7JVI6_9MICO